MQALMLPRLVKVADAQAKVMPPKSATGPATQKKTGSRFLGILLSALSVWSA